MLGQCVRLFVPPWTVAYQASLLGALQARALEWVAILSHGLECAEAVACGVDDHVGFFTWDHGPSGNSEVMNQRLQAFLSTPSLQSESRNLLSR